MDSAGHRTGHCLCEAVSFRASGVSDTFGACHCDMCRRWTGSALLGVTVPAENISWEGTDHIATRQSSAWAERAWCRTCGTGLWFRVTAQSPWSGHLEIPIGLFDDPNGFRMTNEIYIDHKPDSYSFAGDDRVLMTRQDCVDKFAMLDET